jgi:hypothetical protein
MWCQWLLILGQNALVSAHAQYFEAQRLLHMLLLCEELHNHACFQTALEKTRDQHGGCLQMPSRRLRKIVQRTFGAEGAHETTQASLDVHCFWVHIYNQVAK